MRRKGGALGDRGRDARRRRKRFDSAWLPQGLGRFFEPATRVPSQSQSNLGQEENVRADQIFFWIPAAGHRAGAQATQIVAAVRRRRRSAGRLFMMVHGQRTLIGSAAGRAVCHDDCGGEWRIKQRRREEAENRPAEPVPDLAPGLQPPTFPPR